VNDNHDESQIPQPGEASTAVAHETAEGPWGERYLLSQAEAAYRLSISRTTLWRLVTDGEFEVVKIGSRIFIPMTSIHDFIARRTSQPAGRDM